MHAVDAHLVDRDAALIQLLDPPFDHSDPSPGYIQGYVRGVRENGGQYTHAAVWASMAFAALGDTERAWELVNMINPIKHAESANGIAVYKSEPYVVASDVYSRAPHAGRGGWTWYTGSAGWMYRLIVESLLGLTVDSDLLRITPCIPRDWKSFKIQYRYHDTVYDIIVLQAAAGKEGGLILDGVAASGPAITLVDDHRAHTVEVQIPPGASASPAAERAA
jgi:cellobiose phosphorylase